MRLEIMQRAMQAFASMDIDAAKRCLGIVEKTAELHPKPDMTHPIDQAALNPYQMDGMNLFPITDHYLRGVAAKSPLLGAVGILRLTKPGIRPDLS